MNRAYVRKWNRKHVNSYTWRLSVEIKPGVWRWTPTVYQNKRSAERTARKVGYKLVKEEQAHA